MLNFNEKKKNCRNAHHHLRKHKKKKNTKKQPKQSAASPTTATAAADDTRPMETIFNVQIPKAFIDPFFKKILRHPVETKYGDTFELECIKLHIEYFGECPITGKKLELSDLRPNRKIQQEIDEYFQSHSDVEAQINRLSTESNRLGHDIDNLENDKLRKDLSTLLDPIRGHIMRDPVVAADGHTYDRSSIMMWIRDQQRRHSDKKVLSPVTDEALANLDLKPNEKLRCEIVETLLTAEPRALEAEPITGIEALSTIFSIVDEVRDDIGGQMLDTWTPPCVSFLGCPNHGKSSLANRLMMLKFLPQDTILGTGIPIRIEIRRSAVPLPVMIQLWDTSTEEPTPVAGTPVQIISIDKGQRAIAEMMQAAVMEQNCQVATNRELRVTILSPSLPPMILLDLPGVVHAPKPLRIATHAVLNKHLDQDQENAIFLLVIHGSARLAHSSILDVLHEKELEAQTVGVVSHCDMVEGDNNVKILEDNLFNSSLKTHGVVAITSKDKMETFDWESNRRILKRQGHKEVKYFRDQHPDWLAKGLAGTAAVVDRVGVMYAQSLRENLLPKITNRMVIKYRTNVCGQLYEGHLPSPGNLDSDGCAKLRAAAMEYAIDTHDTINKEHRGIFNDRILPNFQKRLQAALPTVTVAVGEVQQQLINTVDKLERILQATFEEINDTWYEVRDRVCSLDPLPFRPHRFKPFVDAFRKLCDDMLRQKVTAEKQECILNVIRRPLYCECRDLSMTNNLNSDSDEPKTMTISFENMVPPLVLAMAMGLETAKTEVIETGIKAMVNELFKQMNEPCECKRSPCQCSMQLIESCHDQRQRLKRKEAGLVNACTRMLKLVLNFEHKVDDDDDWDSLPFLERVKTVVPGLPDSLITADPWNCHVIVDGQKTIVSADADGVALTTGGLPFEAVCYNEANEVIENNGCITFADNNDGTYTINGSPPEGTTQVAITLFGIDITG
mgnify:CR=1 FL=1